VDKGSLWQRKALKSSRLRLLIWGILAAFLVVVHLGVTTPRDALPFLIVQLSDPFAGFVLELGEKSGHVLKRVSVLLGLQQ
jgi:hypothetical protein